MTLQLLTIITGLTLGVQAQSPIVQSQRHIAIELTKNVILAECQQNAGGDWAKWHAQLKPYKQALRPVLDLAWQHPLISRTNPETKYPLIPFVKDQTRWIFANNAFGSAIASDDIKDYATRNRFVPIAKQISSWLRSQDIDLILLPVPTTLEIYPEGLVSDRSLVPRDLNTIPHVRMKFLELLEQDVELVDLYPRLMKARKESADLLYFRADPHWNERAMRLAAIAVAERLTRYPWVKQALKKPIAFAEVVTPHKEPEGWYEFFSDEVVNAMKPLMEGNFRNVVPGAKGLPEVLSPDSPVLVTGDSNIDSFYPPSGGLVGHIAKLINQPVSMQRIPGSLVATFQDMFRDPNILKGKKVVIWVIGAEQIEYDSPERSNFPDKFSIPPSKPK